MPTFTAILFRVPGKGGWTFAPVPDALIPDVSGPWGMTPVTATCEGRPWSTSLWRDRTHGALLPIPAKIRGALKEGDTVTLSFEVDETRGRNSAPR